MHEEEVGLDNVWEVLPQLRGLRTVVFWGCYLTWGTEGDLKRKMSEKYGIRYKVGLLVGREVDVTMTLETDERGQVISRKQRGV